MYILLLNGMTSKSWKKITVLGETQIGCELVWDFQVWLGLQQFAQYLSVLVLPCSLAAGYQIKLLSQLGEVGLQREPEPFCWVRASLSGSVSPSSLLGATPGKMCAVLNLNPANLDNAVVMDSRLSPCFTERKKGSCTGAGQLANFLVLRRLAQL